MEEEANEDEDGAVDDARTVNGTVNDEGGVSESVCAAMSD